MQTRLFAIWWDNFSKTMGTRMPNMEKGIYISALWTGLAIMLYRGEDLQCLYSDNEPAMPPDMFREEDIFLQKLGVALEENAACYENALVTQYDVRRIPLKIDPNLLPDCPETDELKQRSADGLDRFHPWKLVEENCGSNEGMLKILRLFLDRARDSPNKRITVLNSDCNLFYRTCKVCEAADPSQRIAIIIYHCSTTHPLHYYFVHVSILQ
jgi:hypothetical protein